MKILVVSDTHHYNKAMIFAIESEVPDIIIHLGNDVPDCEEISLAYPDIPLHVVKGNGDSGSAPVSDEFLLAGKRFFITHGHLFRVKSSLTNLISEAQNRQVDICLFGHTHLSYHSHIDGILFVNPGSAGISGQNYAVLDIKDGIVNCFLRSALN